MSEHRRYPPLSLPTGTPLSSDWDEISGIPAEGPEAAQLAQERRRARKVALSIAPPEDSTRVLEKRKIDALRSDVAALKKKAVRRRRLSVVLWAAGGAGALFVGYLLAMRLEQGDEHSERAPSSLTSGLPVTVDREHRASKKSEPAPAANGAEPAEPKLTELTEPDSESGHPASDALRFEELAKDKNTEATPPQPTPSEEAEPSDGEESSDDGAAATQPLRFDDFAK